MTSTQMCTFVPLETESGVVTNLRCFLCLAPDGLGSTLPLPMSPSHHSHSSRHRQTEPCGNHGLRGWTTMESELVHKISVASDCLLGSCHEFTNRTGTPNRINIRPGNTPYTGCTWDRLHMSYTCTQAHCPKIYVHRRRCLHPLASTEVQVRPKMNQMHTLHFEIQNPEDQRAY